MAKEIQVLIESGRYKRSKVCLIGVFKGEAQSSEQNRYGKLPFKQDFFLHKKFEIVIEKAYQIPRKLTQMANTWIYANKTKGV